MEAIFQTESLWVRGMKVCSNGPGHETKMVAQGPLGQSVRCPTSIQEVVRGRERMAVENHS